MAEDFLNDYRVNGRRSLDVAQRRVKKHLARFFAGKRAHDITTADIKSFIAKRQEEQASNGEVSLELAALRRMYNLALQAEKIIRKPYIPTLKLHNARQGFFEAWEFAKILPKLPEELRAPIIFAYWTGWRLKDEVFQITWQQIDLEAGTVRLEVNTTKNDDGRLFFLPSDLRALLEQQWADHLSHWPDCLFVFHRNGKRIKDIRGSWQRACKESEIVAKIPHDFRRTAVRNMVRAGIPERVAMQICGHKTRSVFDRYHIVSEGDLREAAQKLSRAFSFFDGHNFGHNPVSG